MPQLRLPLPRLLLPAAAAVLALALPGHASAQSNRLMGRVGPGFEIVLLNASGQPVTQLAPGTYEIVVDDLAANHNFHLTGPGVNQRTEVPFVGAVTWTVTLTDGTYTYVCDPHAEGMRGTFTVGTQQQPPPPPPPPRPAPVTRPGTLTAIVGPGATITLRSASGAAVRRARAGVYTIVVRDRSRAHNFHLVGPGVNRRTGVGFVGTMRWRVRLRAGATYRFVSDPHAAHMRGTFSVQ